MDTAAFHQLMVFGIWGAFLGARERRDPMALLGTLLVSIGYLVMVYPPIAVATNPALTLEAFMDANPAFKLFGLTAIFGTVLFGISILRTQLDPAWIGVVLVIGPLVFAGVMLSQGPASVVIAANLMVAVALLVLGVRSLQAGSAAR